MILSFLVYISLAIALFALGWHVNTREQSRVLANNGTLSFFSWEIVSSIALIVVIMGTRFKTGSDYIMYWTEYLQVGKGYGFSRIGGFESGYELITSLFASLKLHYSIYFGFWALLQASLLYFGLRNHKFLLPWLGLLLVLGPYSINWFSFIRQWVVTCAFVPMIHLIETRRFFLYALITIILTTIHISAVLLLIFYFLPYDKISSWSRKTHLIILLIAILLGLKPIWILVFKPLLPLLPLIGYDRYINMFNDLLAGNYRIVAWGPLHIITFFTQLIIVIYYSQVKKYRPNDRLLPIFFGLAFIAICYDNLFINTVHFLLRPMELLYIFTIIILGYICDFLYNKRRYWELAIVLLPAISYVIINVVKAYIDPNAPMSEIINYHFYFLYSL